MRNIFTPRGRRWLMVAALTLFTALPTPAEAQKISFLRDAEIENTIRAYATPLFLAAGLEPSAINIYIVNDNTLNAFVAGGQKLFLNSGLLMKSESPGQIIGVIAHETGHIAGGHLSQIRDAMRNSSARSILMTILGGIAVIGGRGDVGGAIIAGGQQTGIRSFLQYSRTQEGAADAAGMRFLDSTEQSAQGLLGFFDLLGDQELVSASRQDPYYRSHPMTRERIQALKAHLARSKFSDKPETPEFQIMYDRMVAKLKAFLDPPSRTLRAYKKDPDSLVSRYARAIAYYRRPDLDKALPLIDSLISDYPADPYFNELKGQMLFENGRISEAVPYYEKAVLLMPHSALLRRDLAKVQIELGDDSYLPSAISNLLVAVGQDRSDGFAWNQLAIAYGRLGKPGKSSLALAEVALLRRKPDEARYHAGKAEKLFPKGTPDWLQAQDILSSLDAVKKK
ncbi:MAG: M48 family metalloprotease [Alphaproteobacteria bacterium]